MRFFCNIFIENSSHLAYNDLEVIKMIFSINSNGNKRHEEILKKRLSERLDAEFSDGGLLIDLSTDLSTEKAESFIIEEKDGGFYIKA